MVIAADTQADLNTEIANQRALLMAHTLIELKLCEGQALGTGAEHFGFKDDITNPIPVEAANLGTTPDGVLYTEFVLGGGALPHGSDPIPVWTVNGSYMAFRILHQDVAGFRTQTAAAATALNPTLPTVTAVLPGQMLRALSRTGTPVSDNPAPVLPGASNAVTAMDYINNRASLKILRFSHIRKVQTHEHRMDALAPPSPARTQRQKPPADPPWHHVRPGPGARRP